jgi:hypothetical protein
MIRNDNGKWVKPNPEIIDKLERNNISLRLAINRAEILSQLKNHPAWTTIQEILEEKVKSLDNQLKKFSELDTRKVEALLQQKLDFQFMLTIVDDFADSVPGFESAIARNEKELESRKQPTGA